MFRDVLGVPLFPLILLALTFSATRASESSKREATLTNDWFSGKYTNSVPQYPPTVPGHSVGQELARDSYADAGSTGGIGQGFGSGQAVRYHYQMYPSDSYSHQYNSGFGGGNSYGVPSTEYGVYDDDYHDGNSDGGGSGALGLLGLLGLKGLKGLKALKAGIPFLLPIFFPVFLILGAPLLLLLLIPLIILLFFVPVPVVTIPPAGRRIESTVRELREFALSDECIERISCEVTRFAKNYGFNPKWAQELLDKSPSPNSKWIERVSKGLQSSDCQKFSCSPSSRLSKSIKSTAKKVEKQSI